MALNQVLFIVMLLLFCVGCLVTYGIYKRSKRRITLKETCYLSVLEKLDQAFIVTDGYGKIIELNKGALQWGNDGLGRPLEDVYKIVERETLLPAENLAIRSLVTEQMIEDNTSYQLHLNDSEHLTIGIKVIPIKGKTLKESHAVILMKDETENEKRRNDLLYTTYHDALTGLYNRHFFEIELERLDTERNMPLSLVMLDVNGLKLTNDAFGHDKGDELLKAVSVALKETFRSDDIIARWGGDEFVVVLPKLHDREVAFILKRFSKALESVRVEPVKVSVSYGYAQKNRKDESIKMVMKRAEDLMYRRKLSESMNMRFETIHRIIDEMDVHKSQRIKEHSTAIGKVMGLSSEDMQALETVSGLYDIGNYAIDDSILNKKETLSEEERTLLKRHSEIGYHLLKSVEHYAKLSEAVLSHHERWDGSGYPRKISGESIPITARIIAVADAYEALTSHRPYREAMTHEVAVGILEKEKGKQFDPHVVETFIQRVLN